MKSLTIRNTQLKKKLIMFNFWDWYGLKMIATAIPLWLFAFSITYEGFPPPVISEEVASFIFISGVILSIIFLWRKWMNVPIFLYSLIPLSFMPIFDEISTHYKTPFILSLTFILFMGIIIYQKLLDTSWRWLVLTFFAFFTFFIAYNVLMNYWQMASTLGYANCFPDAVGCRSLTLADPSWWMLFFQF